MKCTYLDIYGENIDFPTTTVNKNESICDNPFELIIFLNKTLLTREL